MVQNGINTDTFKTILLISKKVAVLCKQLEKGWTFT